MSGAELFDSVSDKIISLMFVAVEDDQKCLMIYFHECTPHSKWWRALRIGYDECCSLIGNKVILSPYGDAMLGLM